jgi:hypothetical protein
VDPEFRSAEERRAAIVALTQQETGIDETMIEFWSSVTLQSGQPMAKHLPLPIDAAF